MNSSGATHSIWQEDLVHAGDFPPLAANTETEVCVVGAGIAGLSVAYELCRKGARVAVIDDGSPGGGETGRTTAHLSNALDDRYYFLEERHGREAARLAAESHTAAISRIGGICEEEGIQCDFEYLDGFLFLPPEGRIEQLERELEAAHRAGLREVELFDRAPLRFYNTGPCLRFPRQAQFHPMKYLRGLIGAIRRLGGTIHCGTHAIEIRDGAPAVVKTAGGFEIRAAAVVVATNSPVNNRVAIHTKQAPYRTYVVALEVEPGAVPRGLYWDTAQDAKGAEDQQSPYHYVRLQSQRPGYELMIVGGEDHKTGQADNYDERWGALEAWARARFPVKGPVVTRWSGQVMEPVDGLAYIGKNPGDKSVYIATGDSGHGMTHGAIAGLLLSDLISARTHPWADLYDPDRITPGAAREFARENLNVAKEYADLFTGGEISEVAELPRDCGAILRRGLRKLAVYRDPEGEVHEFSAVCRHLGCIVHWNAAEKTWDCPCHGSRYSRYGEVVNGPSIENLEPVARDEAVTSRTEGAPPSTRGGA